MNNWNEDSLNPKSLKLKHCFHSPWSTITTDVANLFTGYTRLQGGCALFSTTLQKIKTRVKWQRKSESRQPATSRRIRFGEGGCQLQPPLKPEQTRVWLSEQIQWYYHIKKNDKGYNNKVMHVEGRWQLNTNLMQQFGATRHNCVPVSFELCKHRHVIGVSFKTPWNSCERTLVTSNWSLLCLYLGDTVHCSPSVQLTPIAAAMCDTRWSFYNFGSH